MDKTHYLGRSNVSGAVGLDGRHFIVADDEENRLSIYDTDNKDALPAIVLSKLFQGEIKDGKKEEIDLEGAACIGDTYFWIGSHSTSKGAESRSARHRLFGIHLTQNEQGEFTAHRCGSIYTQLLTDLQRDNRFDLYKLDQAARIAPKAIGGLSIEGLAATPEQGLLIGFRNPLAGGHTEYDSLRGGKALLVNLLNPLALLQGQAAKFGNPIELDLGGLGIRDIVWRQGHEYLIVAGPYHDNKEQPEKSRLFLWEFGSLTTEPLDHIDLCNLNIEAAFFFLGQKDCVQLLSDDGENKGFHCVSARL